MSRNLRPVSSVLAGLAVGVSPHADQQSDPNEEDAQLTRRRTASLYPLAASPPQRRNLTRKLAQTSPTGKDFAAKALPRHGFIYGLPIVMNYGVMYEYAVDRNSGQFKAPFNQIKNEPNVFTYKDTAIVTPNSDTPYSFVWMDLLTEPIILSVPAVDPKRYYSVMLWDGNTFTYGYIGSRATGSRPAITSSSRRSGREQLRSGSKRYSAYRAHNFLCAGSLAAPRRSTPPDYATVQKVQAGYKVTDAFQLGQGAKPVEAKIDPSVDIRKSHQKIQVDTMPDGQVLRLRDFAPASSRLPQLTDEAEHTRPDGAHWSRSGQELRLQGQSLKAK